ncbi:60S ribosomal protein L36 [Polytolypa hystricis UAMH7299]|uniref:60S ribosomal protein L36 n=1 Tax=Polytolypa hystricis (strain UAMH7299) TaxID=1447883 RepID=A0A2B7Y4B8_POLH7|nr:60S ribosomal protein L36 [Polytolypa hystricis UAMH7299]
MPDDLAHFNIDNDKTRPTNPPTHPVTNISSSPITMAKERSGIIVGLNKGHKTTANESKPRISRTKGHLSRRTAFVRDIVKEVAGLAPYERRVVELLRNSQDKRARKLAKKRLGTFGRAKAKVDEMQKVIAEARRAGLGH